MGALGISTQERSDYVGWASTTQATSYSLMKSRAMNSNVPYVLAGRDSKDDPPHAMWKLLDEVPDIVVGYWNRVNYIAVAAKAINVSVTIDASFQGLMDKHLKDAKKKKADSANPKLLLKRIRELGRDVQLERSKRARLELMTTAGSDSISGVNDDGSTTGGDEGDAPQTAATTTITAAFDHAEALTILVNELKTKRKEICFPAFCNDSFAQLSTLIDASSTPTRTFGIAMSTAVGKDLARILLLVVLNDRCPGTQLLGGSQNWFSWMDANRKVHPFLKRVSIKSWQAFMIHKTESKT